MKRDLDILVTQMHSSGMRYDDAVREFKRQYLREVLVAHRGNQCKAAEELGMHRNTLSRAMAELGLDLAEVRAGLNSDARLICKRRCQHVPCGEISLGGRSAVPR